MDYMQRCLDAYYVATRWPRRSHYSSLLAPSRELLDFPTAAGVSFSVGKAVSSALCSSYRLALPPFTPAASFLFTSVPLPRLRLPQLDHEPARIVQPVQDSTSLGKPYLLYGKLYPSGKLEYLGTRRLGRGSQLVISGISTASRREMSYITYHLQFVSSALTAPVPIQSPIDYEREELRRNWGVELSFHSIGAIFGLQCLRRIGSQWSVGGELYYLANDVSGGLSIGVRRDSAQPPLTHNGSSGSGRTARDQDMSPLIPGQFTRSSTALTANPLLGHIAATYISQLAVPVWACARYEYNVYSYDSDLSVGLQYRALATADKDHSSAGQDHDSYEGSLRTRILGTARNAIVRAKFSTSRGLALALEESWRAYGGKWRVSMGVMTELKQSAPKRSLGLDVQYEW
ncbi:Mitochondrial distribution and morphology protein 10 [Sorochytrium milnesiophthora]